MIYEPGYYHTTVWTTDWLADQTLGPLAKAKLIRLQSATGWDHNERTTIKLQVLQPLETSFNPLGGDTPGDIFEAFGDQGRGWESTTAEATPEEILGDDIAEEAASDELVDNLSGVAEKYLDTIARAGKSALVWGAVIFGSIAAWSLTRK